MPPRSFLHPRFWPTWIFLGLLRLLALLPMRAGWRAGAGIGLAAYHLLQQRRRVTHVNLNICFPELTPAQRNQLARDAFRAAGIALVEIGWAWWGRPLPLRVVGEDDLRAALAKGKGAILLGGHYTPIELSGRHFFTIDRVGGVYRPNDNPLLEWMITRQRSKFCDPIARQDLRGVRRKLLKNGIVWLAPDQDFGYRNSEFVTFFGHTAATLTMSTRLAQLNDSPVFFLRHQREAAGYVLEMTPMPEFPGASPKDDAALFNSRLEAAIRLHPEQYLWMHKRFKTQPDGRRKLYQAANC